MRNLSFPARILLILTIAVLALLTGRAIQESRHGELITRLRLDAARIFDTPYFRIGTLPITPAFLVKMLLFLLVLAFVCSRVARGLRRVVLDRATLDEGQKYALERAITYAVYGFGLLIALETAGLNLSSLTVFGGALGIGLGFGLQHILHNFVSGFLLLIERPIKVGDRVEIDGVDGIVNKIGARSTWVRTSDNIVMILPNSEFIVKPVVNWTAHSRQVRVRLPFSLPNSVDPAEARRVLLDVAAANADVLGDPPPEVGLAGFAGKDVNYELQVWTSSRVDTHQAFRSDLNFAIFAAFRDHGLVTPDEAPKPAL